jgi:hypothetical protein
MNKENKIRDLLNSLEENLNESINDNIEPIEDFKVFNKYFIDWYNEDISKKLGLWISYSHSQRYCDKIDNFLNELK